MSQDSIGQWWNRYRTNRGDATERIVLFIRGFRPAMGTHSHRLNFVRTLTEAAEEEAVDSVDITVVGKEICICEKCREIHSRQTVHDVVETLKSWRDGGIRPSGFTEREINSSITGEHHRVVTPPELTLGVYLDDSLVGVFPCTADGRTHTPEMFLQELTSKHLGEKPDSFEQTAIQ